MRIVLLCTWSLLLMGRVQAQDTQKKTMTEKEGLNKEDIVKKELKKSRLNKKDTFSSRGNVSLSSTGNYKAFATPTANNHFQIADPTIKTFNAKANGADLRYSGTPLIGVPKGTYGFADGRLTLYSSGATSSGTITGNGSVGTGTSPGAFGTYGSGLGVNGKSPYSGQGPYGTRVPVLTKQPDSTTSVKRKH